MRITLLAAFLLLLRGHTDAQQADWLIYNARIYTMDSAFRVVEAIAIKDGKVLATGTTRALKATCRAARKLDARGRFIYPGFIDAHAHFVEYGLGLQRADLVGTTSWLEVLDRLRRFSRNQPRDQWLIGWGWDQNDWTVREFPDNGELNRLFPDQPVLLSRVDGHAAIANDRALAIAGIHPGDQIPGGEIETRHGRLTGILVDNAVGLVERRIPAPTPQRLRQALLDAQTRCFAAGLTTVDDCGLDYRTVEFLDSLQRSGDLKMRVYAMLSDAPANYQYAFRRGKIETDRLHVCAFKVYADGALGSRGACLLQPYSDKPGWSGFLLSSREHFDSVAALIHAHGWQMCTHAIGDSGNRVMLQVYAKYLQGPNDLRWRIEHAQVIAPDDFRLFGQFSIIPSVQPTHATSDMYWAADRLGPQRVRGAYAYKQLLAQNGWIPLGTDFPVEDISPLRTFYAAVVRKDAKGWPAQGFQMENALTRREALLGMTRWAARANFEETRKGSLEKGKWADLVMLDQDLMEVPAGRILSTQVLATFVQGEPVYRR
ncbi:MAG TPA: amidohydrolase [Chitinophagaceae bacterium]|nr:amidohydrolase [Chitinophagaceae bacterium]